MSVNTNPLLFNVTSPPVPVTAKDFGVQMAVESADKQAAILNHWTAEVANYSPAVESWAMQCRNIAEQMSDDECRAVAVMLESLVEHLEAVPVERLAAKVGGASL